MRVIKSLLAGALALGLTTSVAVADGHGWKPKKPVEFIIMAGAGGGADLRLDEGGRDGVRQGGEAGGGGAAAGGRATQAGGAVGVLSDARHVGRNPSPAFADRRLEQRCTDGMNADKIV